MCREVYHVGSVTRDKDSPGIRGVSVPAL
jgi:hypothetical protein